MNAINFTRYSEIALNVVGMPWGRGCCFLSEGGWLVDFLRITEISLLEDEIPEAN